MYDIDGLDTMGEDLAVVGAAARRAMARRAPLSRAIASARPSWLKLATEQGVSVPDEELDFLPFESVTLSNDGTTVVSSGSLTTFPQRPFRGERLIMAAYGKVDGTAGDFLFAVAISPAIYVGAVQVGATQGATPASSFAATAFGVRLSLPTAGQGTRITIPVLVPPSLLSKADDTVTITATLIGRAVR